MLDARTHRPRNAHRAVWLAALLAATLLSLGARAVAHEHQIGATSPCAVCAQDSPQALEAQAPKLCKQLEGISYGEAIAETVDLGGVLTTAGGPRAPPASGASLTR